MDFILLEYVNNDKYGKLAHFINDKDEDVYSKVIEVDDTVIYEELSPSIQEELKSIYLHDED